MPTSDPGQGIGFLLSDVARLMRRNFDRRVQALGLTQAQWRALTNLTRCEGCNQAKLAEALEVKPITLARLIDRLQANGWVERRPDPADRRAVRLYLTPKAQPLIEQLWALGADTRAAAFAGVDDATCTLLVSTLQAMKDNLLQAEPALRAEAGGAAGG